MGVAIALALDREQTTVPITPLMLRWTGASLAVVATWPMVAALRAIESNDYLAGALLVALTWVVARTGLDLANTADADEP